MSHRRKSQSRRPTARHPELRRFDELCCAIGFDLACQAGAFLDDPGDPDEDLDYDPSLVHWVLQATYRHVSSEPGRRWSRERFKEAISRIRDLRDTVDRLEIDDAARS